MDALVLVQKIESLRRCIRRVEEKSPSHLQDLFKDADLQDILVLNLTRAVQLCVDIGSHIISQSNETAPGTMGEVFSALERMSIISAETSESMKKAVGFRNVAVHNYDAINWEIVFAICRKSVPEFRQFVSDISAFAKI
jgi:uncharacterized protein YutE (UPF0331/DUF86 family)